MENIIQIIPCYKDNLYFHIEDETGGTEWENPVVAFALEEAKDGTRIVSPLMIDKEGVVESPFERGYERLKVELIEKQEER